MSAPDAVRVGDRRAARTHYSVLGVDENAPRADIARAFRSLALSLHPDRQPNGDGGTAPAGGADGDFARVAEAYEVLSDAERRREYDATLALDRGGGAAPPSVSSLRPGTANGHIPSAILRNAAVSPSYGGFGGSFDAPIFAARCGSAARPPTPAGGQSALADAARQRWDDTFVERNGRFERRPASKQSSRRGSVPTPFVARPATPITNTLPHLANSTPAGSALPPRAPSAGPMHSSAHAHAHDASSRSGLPPAARPHSQQQQHRTRPESSGALQQPATAFAAARNRQLMRHRERLSSVTTASDIFSSASPANAASDVAPLPVDGTGPIELGVGVARGPHASVGSADARRPTRAARSQSPLDLFPDGPPQVAYIASYDPRSSSPFLRLDQFASPTRRAASSSLRDRKARTTGTAQRPTPSREAAFPALRSSFVATERQRAAGRPTIPMMRGESPTRTERTMMVFFPERGGGD